MERTVEEGCEAGAAVSSSGAIASDGGFVKLLTTSRTLMSHAWCSGMTLILSCVGTFSEMMNFLNVLAFPLPCPLFSHPSTEQSWTRLLCSDCVQRQPAVLPATLQVCSRRYQDFLASCQHQSTTCFPWSSCSADSGTTDSTPSWAWPL